VVCDIESLVFWLNALDAMHADVDGKAALASADMLNMVLAVNETVALLAARAPKLRARQLAKAIHALEIHAA
jgi:methylglyoxal synthase